MCESNCLCVMPPAPDLAKRILKTKAIVLSGQTPSESIAVDVLDLRTFTLIVERPNKTRAHTLVAPTRDYAPVTGTRRALVCLVDFSDKAAATGQQHYTDLLFSVGSYTGGSMRDFYREASYGQLDVDGEVAGTGGPTAGWFRAPQAKTVYTDNQFGFGAYPKNAQKLCEDVVDLAAPHVNFANYDNDGDGVVEAFVVIVAGSGGEVTGNANDIWSHKWGINPKTVDGVTVSTYFMAPEDGRVGVMSHELGHLLMGWPDLYDTDYTSAGTGRWDLMAGGSWNGGGNTPAHPSAWCKAKVGWVNPTVVHNSEVSATILPYSENPSVFKLPVGAPDSKEYFLVSNRQLTRFDSNLPGPGLICEHCDENRTNNTDETHYLVDIEQADGRRDLNLNANSGDADDPFPFGSNNAFTASTTPSSRAYDGSDSLVEILDIARAGANVTARLKVGGGAVWAWYSNRLVLYTFCSYHTQNCWAWIEGLGWRKIVTGNADGVTNLFALFCDAQANGKRVTAYADATSISIAQLA